MTEILFKTGAARLIESGYRSPIPTQPRSKAIYPSGGRFLYDVGAAGTSAGQVADWSRTWPDAGIGMACFPTIW